MLSKTRFAKSAKADTSKICAGLSAAEKRNYLHKSILKTDHFQTSLPRLPIPEVHETLRRYTDSLMAQAGSVISAQDVLDNHKMIYHDFDHINKLHELLLKFDKKNQHSSYLSAAWFDMYLSTRSTLPFNNTPFIGCKRNENEASNEITLRAANVIISSLRMNKTLENNWLEPEIFYYGKQGSQSTFDRNRKIVKYLPPGVRVPVPEMVVPVGLRVLASYQLLNGAPLDVSQYKNLFKSTRIPKIGKDELVKYSDSRHVSVMCRGYIYKLEVLNKDQTIVDYNAIHKAISQIYSDAKSRPHNPSPSAAYFSSMERDEWAKAREELINHSEETERNLHILDSAIFNIALDDSVTKPLDFNPEDNKLAQETFLWGDGASRWWDKSFSWIITEGGDLACSFEHSWGDGVAILRLLKDVYGETNGNPCITESNLDNYESESATWSKVKFDLSQKSKDTLLRAKTNYNTVAADIKLSACITQNVGKDFFKSKKLSPDAMLQLAIQYAWLKINNGDPCPVYESVSTGAFLHGRTDNLRPMTIDSSRVAKRMILNDGKTDNEEFKWLFQRSQDFHGRLKTNATMSKGFDRHIFAMNNAAKLNDLKLPECFDIDNNETFKRMNHYVLSTSTVDSSEINGGGFCNVVPEGFGVGYSSQKDLIAVGVAARESTMIHSPSDFTTAFAEGLEFFRKIYD